MVRFTGDAGGSFQLFSAQDLPFCFRPTWASRSVADKGPLWVRKPILAMVRIARFAPDRMTGGASRPHNSDIWQAL